MGGRVLVVGASGFIGSHAGNALREAGHQVIGTSRDGAETDLACDLLDPASVEAALTKSEPEAVVLAAGISSVKAGWQDPEACFSVNVRGTFNLLEALSRAGNEPSLLLASSASVYGRPSESATDAFDEESVPDPTSPYGASKLAAEVLCRQYARQYGVSIAVLRFFNQVGPGHGTGQAPSEFARQMAVAEMRGERGLMVPVGSPESERDFTDVRDSARAIQLAVEAGLDGTFNVCSGNVLSIGEVIHQMSEFARIEVGMEVRPGEAHPEDVKLVAGSADRFRQATCWQAQIGLAESFEEMLEDWRERL